MLDNLWQHIYVRRLASEEALNLYEINYLLSSDLSNLHLLGDFVPVQFLLSLRGTMTIPSGLKHNPESSA